MEFSIPSIHYLSFIMQDLVFGLPSSKLKQAATNLVGLLLSIYFFTAVIASSLGTFF